MQPADTLFTNARLASGRAGSIAVSGGAIVSIGLDVTALQTVDLRGALVLPGFVEGHIHLDTSFYGDKWQPHRPCSNGFDVHERVAFQNENLARAAPMAQRARDQLELCVAHGTTHMRSHVMIDASVGLRHLETILGVREEYRDVLDLQLVAFPQSGILASPGTDGLLDEAIGMGCDLVGGIDPATFDRDVAGHLDIVFGIAEKRGVGIDIHLHDGGTLGTFQLDEIAARAKSLGMEGRVAVSHAYALGAVPADIVARTAARLSEAGVAIMTNAPGAYTFPPVLPLREAGVTVFSGSDNIRDSWWPYGDGDMLGRAMLIGYRSGFYTDEELLAAFDVVTASGARALGIQNYGLEPGNSADFVVVDAEHVPEAVVGVPRGRQVYKRGRLVATEAGLVDRVPLAKSA